MIKLVTYFIILSTLLITIIGCEKEIDLDLPQYEPKVVIDGRIEQGIPPIVFLSKSQSFFGEVDLAAYQNSFVTGAKVVVSNGSISDTLTEICSNNLPQGLDTIVAQFLGIDVADLSSTFFCAYTTINTSIFGEVGKHYTLSVTVDNETYTSKTSIPNLIPLDSLWYKPSDVLPDYGFSWATLTDPDSIGNGYRWYVKRGNTDSNGNIKDLEFLSPIGSSFDDEFINGNTFDFAYERPDSDNDEGNDRDPYFKPGDTIIVKFCTLERAAVNYLRATESQVLNNGSPFASPGNLPTNIQGGALGLWVGYGVTYDTTIAQ